MVHTTMLRAFPENLRKTTETIIPRAPPSRTMFDDVGAEGCWVTEGSVLLGMGSGSPAWDRTARKAQTQVPCSLCLLCHPALGVCCSSWP